MENQQEGTSYTRLVSHQLKSPINAVQSLIKTITDGYAGEVSPQARQTLIKALGRAEEATSTISDLLRFEGYAQSDRLEMKEIDAVALLNSLIRDLSFSATEKSINLKSSIPLNRKIILRGDNSGLEHAFRNLIDNAIKYTPEQGRVSVALEVPSGDGIVRIRIEDTGDGIPENEMDQLFSPFFRSRKQKNKKPGTGLGLAIVKRVIDVHEGSIDVESKEEEGTAFTVTLPLVREETAETEEVKRKRVVIVGGVTSGPKAAARLRRLDETIDITIIEQHDFLSYSGCELPNYISGRFETFGPLLSTQYHTVRNAHFFETFKNITAYTGTKAVAIDRKAKELKTEETETGKKVSYPYDTLILATGSIPAVPDIPGIDHNLVIPIYSLEEAERLKRKIEKRGAQEVYMLGGGLIGVTLAQSLVETGCRVTILEKEDTILKNYLDPDFGKKLTTLLTRKGIRIICDSVVEKITGDSRGLRLEGPGGSHHADLVILCAGVRPNSKLAEDAGLAIGPLGGIAVDEQMRTSDDSILAAGDCAETPHLISGDPEYWPLGSVSTKMGRIAADTASGRKTRFPGSLGTTLFTCFDIHVARTGLTAAAAAARGYDTETALVTGPDKPATNPEAGPIFLKLIADRKTGTVLGAQALGTAAAASKIALLAEAISYSLGPEDIFNLDLGYSPETTTPIDIIQTAGNVLRNKLDGIVETLRPEELDGVDKNAVFIALYPQSAVPEDLIPGSITIAPENLRHEDLEFEKDRQIILYCTSSALAYQAYRYLKSRDYTRLQVLEGGHLFWR